MTGPGGTVEAARYDVVVVGAGAAGLMASIFSARSGARTLLLERTADGGRKILISGGGRCNVLPGSFRPERYVTDSSPNTLRKILRSWPLDAQRRFFEVELGIPLKHEADGDKLFPASDRARDIRDRLVGAVRQAGGRIEFGRTVAGVRELDSSDGGDGSPLRWRITSEEGATYDATSLILATGGLSVAATGSDGRGLRWARELGHEMHATYPALTPLTADPPLHAHLAGVSLVSRVTAERGSELVRSEGGVLFTHRGYSGPAILDVSHVAARSREEGHPPARVRVDWTGEGAEAWQDRLGGRSGAVLAALSRRLPQRLALQLLREAGLPEERRLAQLRREERRRLVELLSAYPLPWTGDEGYRKAEVTGGGVALSDMDPSTLESRRCAGLHLCGEMLDAFGPIGGHNFLWAWATGRAAGRAAGEAAGAAAAAASGRGP